MAQLLSTMDMDINNDIIRKRFTSFSKNNLKESSILSNISSVAYYKQMEVLNNILPNKVQTSIDSSQLSCLKPPFVYSRLQKIYLKE